MKDEVISELLELKEIEKKLSKIIKTSKSKNKYSAKNTHLIRKQKEELSEHISFIERQLKYKLSYTYDQFIFQLIDKVKKKSYDLVY